MKKADIGMIGLAVMGENLVVNMLDHGFRVAVFNRNTDKVRNFVEGRGKGRDVVGAYSLQELVDSLEPPRRVMMLIRAGSAVDEMLSKLTPLLKKGDIIIDGGKMCIRDSAGGDRRGHTLPGRPRQQLYDGRKPRLRRRRHGLRTTRR